MERLEWLDYCHHVCHILSAMSLLKTSHFYPWHCCWDIFTKCFVYTIHKWWHQPICARLVLLKAQYFYCLCELLMMTVFKNGENGRKLLIYFQSAVLFWYVGRVACSVICLIHMSQCRVWSKWCRRMLYKYNSWKTLIVFTT